VLNIPEKKEMQAFINPEILTKSGIRSVNEGCLSFPNYSGLVNRSVKITARCLDEMGGNIKFTAEELFSQALEHEIDHLNGILFIDHLKEHEKLINSDPEYRPHTHDIGITAEIIEDNKTDFNQKIYSKIKLDELKEALTRAHILNED
jgi:hypothetical protein